MAANESAVSVRLEPASQGQTAHDLRLGPQPSYVHADKSHRNRVLIEPLRNDDLREEWERIKKAVGKKGVIRSNQNLAYSGIVTFGIEAQKIFEALTVERQDAALLELSKKVAEKFDTKLKGLVVHCDESALHAHFQVLGMGENGVVLSSLVKRGALRDVQTIAAEVMGEYAPGIERGTSRIKRLEDGETYAETVHRQVNTLHHDLPIEITALTVKRDELVKQIAVHERRAKESKAKADKETAKADEVTDKAARHLKNAARYEDRANNARDNLASTYRKIDRLEKVQDNLKTENLRINEELAQKKTTVQKLTEKRNSLSARLQTLRAA